MTEPSWATEFARDLLRYPVGSRVWVSHRESSDGLRVRSGTVEEIPEFGSDGRFVRHDDGQRFGWSARNELVTLARIPWPQRFAARLLGYVLPIWWRIKRRLFL